MANESPEERARRLQARERRRSRQQGESASERTKRLEKRAKRRAEGRSAKDDDGDDGGTLSQIGRNIKTVNDLVRGFPVAIGRFASRVPGELKDLYEIGGGAPSTGEREDARPGESPKDVFARLARDPAFMSRQPLGAGPLVKGAARVLDEPEKYVTPKEGETPIQAAEEKFPLLVGTVESVKRTRHRLTNPTEYARAFKRGDLVPFLVEDLANLSVVAEGTSRLAGAGAQALRAGERRAAAGFTARATEGVVQTEVPGIFGPVRLRGPAAQRLGKAAEVAESVERGASVTARLGARVAGGPAEPYRLAYKVAKRAGVKSLQAGLRLFKRTPGARALAQWWDDYAPVRAERATERATVKEARAAATRIREEGNEVRAAMHGAWRQAARLLPDKTHQAALSAALASVPERLGDAFLDAPTHVQETLIKSVLGPATDLSPEVLRLARDYQRGALPEKLQRRFVEARGIVERGFVEPATELHVTGFGESPRLSEAGLARRATEDLSNVPRPSVIESELRRFERARRQRPGLTGLPDDALTERLQGAIARQEQGAERLTALAERPVFGGKATTPVERAAVRLRSTLDRLAQAKRRTGAFRDRVEGKARAKVEAEVTAARDRTKGALRDFRSMTRANLITRVDALAAEVKARIPEERPKWMGTPDRPTPEAKAAIAGQRPLVGVALTRDNVDVAQQLYGALRNEGLTHSEARRFFARKGEGLPADEWVDAAASRQGNALGGGMAEREVVDAVARDVGTVKALRSMRNPQNAYVTAGFSREVLDLLDLSDAERLLLEGDLDGAAGRVEGAIDDALAPFDEEAKAVVSDRLAALSEQRARPIEEDPFFASAFDEAAEARAETTFGPGDPFAREAEAGAGAEQALTEADHRSALDRSDRAALEIVGVGLEGMPTWQEIVEARIAGQDPMRPLVEELTAAEVAPQLEAASERAAAALEGAVDRSELTPDERALVSAAELEAKEISDQVSLDEARALVSDRLRRRGRQEGRIQRQIEQAAVDESRLRAAMVRLEEQRAQVARRTALSPEAAPAKERTSLKLATAMRDTALELADELDAQVPGMGKVYRDAAAGTLTTLDLLGKAGIDATFLPGGRNPKGSVRFSRPSAVEEGSLARRRKLTHVRTGFDVEYAFQPLARQAERKIYQAIENEVVEGMRVRFAKAPAQLLDEVPARVLDLAEAMRQEGYSAWNPSTVWQKVADEAVTPDSLFLPTRILQTLRKETVDRPERLRMGEIATTGDLAKWAVGATVSSLDVGTKAWKILVLPLRPEWLVNNVLGNSLTATIGGGVTPADLLRHHAEVIRILRARKEGIKTRVPERVLEGFTEEFGDIRVQPAARWNVLGRTVDASFRANSFVDSYTRTLVFLTKEAKGLNVETAAREALKAAGDFMRLNATEKYVIRRALPFYTWLRHITRLTFTLPIEHPMRVAWTLHLSDLYGDPSNEDLPEWLQGWSPVGGGGANPFSSVPTSSADWLRSFNPVIGAGIETLTGLDVQRARMATPNREPGLLSAREAANLLISTVPQSKAARAAIDDLRGRETVVRRATGQKIYDEFGREIPADSLFDEIRRLLGFPSRLSPEEIASIQEGERRRHERSESGRRTER